jgi:hypothetical protein
LGADHQQGGPPPISYILVERWKGFRVGHKERHKKRERELREVEAVLRRTEGDVSERSSNGDNGEETAEENSAA